MWVRLQPFILYFIRQEKSRTAEAVPLRESLHILFLDFTEDIDCTNLIRCNDEILQCPHNAGGHYGTLWHLLVSGTVSKALASTGWMDTIPLPSFTWKIPSSSSE